MCELLATYVHQIDPFAIGPVRWYGLSYVVGFLIGWLVIRRVTQVGISSVHPQNAGDLVITLAIGIVVGGRLGYVLFYQPDMLWSFTKEMPFWDVLAINRGGMASHGGMIGLIVASWWFAYRHGHRWTHVMDLGAFGAPLGLCFGRIANFINGELYGREAAADLPWAVKFPQEMIYWDGALLTELERQLPPPPAEQITTHGQYIDWILREIQSGNQQAVQLVEPWLLARHPSQLYQAALEGLLLFIILAVFWAKPRKPMLVGGMFCAVYGILRIVAEFYRLPDAHIGLQGNLSRGQWLSIALTALGVTLIVIFSKKKTPPMGGWLRGSKKVEQGEDEKKATSSDASDTNG